jgi:hypothetical protein
LFRQQFELIAYRRSWGEERVWFQDGDGRTHSQPASWTDIIAVDPFVAVAAGRSLFRVADLIELAKQIDEWKLGCGSASCKGKDAVVVNQILSERQKRSDA